MTAKSNARGDTLFLLPMSIPAGYSGYPDVFISDYQRLSFIDDQEVQVRDLDGGKRIAQALSSHRAIILRNHGLLTVANQGQLLNT